MRLLCRIVGHHYLSLRRRRMALVSTQGTGFELTRCMRCGNYQVMETP